MPTLFDCSGRTAIITGASRGLGAAAAQALAGAGANVALVGRDLGALEEQASLAEAQGVTAMTIVCDVGHHHEIPAAVAKARACFGAIDILVNNAGIIRRSPAEQYSLEDWNDVIGVNTTAAFLMAQETGREMIARGYGRIINIASLLSFSGGLNVVAYTASKSAIAGVTRALANEWGRHGVNVNAIAPGYFHTDATAALQQNTERYNALLARIPAGRWGDPADLQGAIVFLASAASTYVNGHILAVDGGWMAA
ncbi:MAG: SDR family oxidoreductase [Bacteroidetes bacterium]|nr:SDR family oxidoreductase [Bacteroidota bacterium]